MKASPLDRYFAGLDGGDDDAAAAVFAEDALYIRPAVGQGSSGRGYEVLRGRQEIRDFFARRRELQRQHGGYDHRHDIRSVATDGRQLFVEGLMTTGAGTTGVFLSHATLDEDGLVKRYITSFTPTPDGFEEPEPA